ncbi:hypothetical protein DFJ74DRAFT_755369 [Hyaloraphidium curvatum]|nr:hypothetical protein DFJ74DRAFT_755369 [Hyaloraphidium curvatum]
MSPASALKPLAALTARAKLLFSDFDASFSALAAELEATRAEARRDEHLGPDAEVELRHAISELAAASDALSLLSQLAERASLLRSDAQILVPGFEPAEVVVEDEYQEYEGSLEILHELEEAWSAVLDCPSIQSLEAKYMPSFWLEADLHPNLRSIAVEYLDLDGLRNADKAAKAVERCGVKAKHLMVDGVILKGALADLLAGMKRP